MIEYFLYFPITITTKRIENGNVVFEYKDYRDSKKKEMALSPVEFIRRFMLHILPNGFFKIRYYGMLSSKKKKATLQRCREILKNRKIKEPQNNETTKSFTWECPKCKSCGMHALRVSFINDTG